MRIQNPADFTAPLPGAQAKRAVTAGAPLRPGLMARLRAWFIAVGEARVEHELRMHDAFRHADAERERITNRHTLQG